MKFRAAILEKLNELLVLAEVENEPLGIGQVLVQILVSGICGAQLAEIRGEKGNAAHLPHLLGHEAAAQVVEIGPGVTTVQPGDKVVCHWRKGEGIESDFPRYQWGDRGFTSGRVTTFSEYSVCSENRLTRVSDDTPNELCALLGCGLSTALGVMENEAKLKMGESVLIVGCGGVGLNLIRVARMMGAARIYATDMQSSKMQPAFDAGALSFSAELERSIGGFDVIVDTTGNPVVISNTLRWLSPSGRYVMVGQPKFTQAIAIHDAVHMFAGEGKTIKATQGGAFQPDKDIPRYVAAWKSRFLDLKGIVTHRFPFAQINGALDFVRSGQAGRVMLEMT